MTPEQIQRAKSIVEYAAVESLETEEIILLGWAIQAIAARDTEIEALREEVRLTNEHEHAIMMELSAARDEIANLKRGGVDAAELDAISDAIRYIGNYAHVKSTGPAVPDALWDIRSRAYDACARIDGIRAIPANRELMRLVDELIRWHGLRPLDKRPDHAAVLVGAIKALRAQATTNEGDQP